MDRWQQVLRENDPATERMDSDTAARMRDAVVRVARSRRTASVWPMRLALAAFACVVMLLSVGGTRHPVSALPHTAPLAGFERRQIQFATPGGTRIIWEINPGFTLGETIP